MEGKNNNIIKLPFQIPKYKTYSINTAINGILKAYKFFYQKDCVLKS